MQLQKLLIFAWAWTVIAFPAIANELDRKTVQIAKDATAFVVAGDKSATAFCFDASGHFATSYGLLADLSVARKVRLVLYPSESREKEVEGEIVYLSKEDDLAILRVAGPITFIPLELGSTEALMQTDTVIGLSYPFGELLSLHKGNYPTVTVNSGNVTTIVKDGTGVISFNTDITANPGCAGGPILNANGKVVGIFRYGIKGARLAVASPIEKLRSLGAAPQLEFEPLPVHSLAESLRPASYKARVKWILPQPEKCEVNLVITAPGMDIRTIPMELKSGYYVAQATLNTAGESLENLVANIRYPNSSMTGLIEDRQFELEGKKYWLHDVNLIRSMVDGQQKIVVNTKVHTGLPSGLKSIGFKIGTQTIELPTKEIKEFKFMRNPDSLSWMVSVVVSSGEQIVANRSYRVALNGSVTLDQPSKPQERPASTTKTINQSAPPSKGTVIRRTP